MYPATQARQKQQQALQDYYYTYYLNKYQQQNAAARKKDDDYEDQVRCSSDATMLSDKPAQFEMEPPRATSVRLHAITSVSESSTCHSTS